LAVKLRLTRRGKKKQPFYRIIAADSRTARDGKYIEKVGLYNPLTDPAEVLIDEEKAFYWLSKGAIPSDTVKNLFSKKGIMLKWSLKKKGLDEIKIEEEFKKWEVIQLEQQKKKEALVAQDKRESEDKKVQEQVEKDEQPVVAEAQGEEKNEAVESEEKVEKDEQAAIAEAKVEEKTETVITEDKVEVKEDQESAPGGEDVSDINVDEAKPGDEQPVAEAADSKPEEQLPNSDEETDSKDKE